MIKFFDKDGNGYPNSNVEIIEKFQKITGIKERRYADKEHKTSDLATLLLKMQSWMLELIKKR